MLKPMLFDPVVNATWGAKKRARGFQALQKALFLSCAQDVAKIMAGARTIVCQVCTTSSSLWRLMTCGNN